jgi:serine protease inhibitor
MSDMSNPVRRLTPPITSNAAPSNAAPSNTAPTAAPQSPADTVSAPDARYRCVMLPFGIPMAAALPSQVPASALKQVVQASNRLSFGLVASLRKPGESIFLSGTSINIALAMLAQGAEGDTKNKLCAKLGVEQGDVSQLAAAVKTLRDDLVRQRPGTTVEIANSIWSRKDTPLSEGFKTRAQSFKADVNSEFESLEQATSAIESWVAERTHNMIKNLVSGADLVSAPVVLLNATYVKNDWLHKFNRRDTQKDVSFTCEDKSTVKVQMMHKRGTEVQVADGDTYRAAQLPYGADEEASGLSFVAILPNEGQSIDDVLANLREKDLPRQFHAVKHQDFALPIFEGETTAELKRALCALGLPLDAGFTGLSTQPLTVAKILHKAKIKVNEEGTEASAATSIMMRKCAAPVSRPSLVFDRPFVYGVISDKDRNMLFTGVYTGKAPAA